MQEKKGIDFVGMLVALVIFLVAAGAGVFAASVIDGMPTSTEWAPRIWGGAIFLLLLITGVALQRRFRP